MHKPQDSQVEVFCSSIPLHQTNLIQPQGVLIAVDKDLKIVQASENAVQLFGIAVAELIGTFIIDHLDKQSYSTLSNNIDSYQLALPADLVITASGKPQRVSAVIHEKDNCLLIEIELPSYISQSDGNFNSFFQQIQNVMSSINNCESVVEVARIAARKIKEFAHFDKVMIYSFDDDWVGTVIAEEMEKGMDSYLGLHFPSSDIPKQARDLYLKNPYRLIPDRNYEPVALFPELNPVTNSPTDLSDCKYRSVLRVHLEYLKNMNVVASMSTRIIHKEKLWGLIACHHRTAKYLSFQECSMFEFLSNVISTKIGSLLFRRSAETRSELESKSQNIIQQLSAKSIYEGLNDVKHELKGLFRADGLALVSGSNLQILGAVPSEKNIRLLVEWLKGRKASHSIQFPDLPFHFDPARKFSDTASGLLCIPVNRDNHILLFRAELIKNVRWGGDPNEVLNFEQGTNRYHPRNSFAIWKETVRFTSEPWLKEELEVAEILRVALVEIALNEQTGRRS